MVKQENLNDPESGPEETPEQKEMSEQLRQMAKNADVGQEKGELPDPQKEIEDYLKEKIRKEKGSLQVAEGDKNTYESMQEDASWDSVYLRKAKDNVFPDELYKMVQQELIVIPGEPLDEEDYQQHKEEYDNSKREFEERKARVKRMLTYMDQFRTKQK